jgi:hypothetical protein
MEIYSSPLDSLMLIIPEAVAEAEAVVEVEREEEAELILRA